MKRRALLAAVLLMSLPGASEAASTWYVKADAASGGNGSRNRPFATLEQVETASRPGDTIRVLPSTGPLDGGIQLKDGRMVIQGGWMAEPIWHSGGRYMRACFIVSSVSGETPPKRS